MPKTQLKTLDDLRAALLRLMDPFDGSVEARKYVVTSHTGPATNRSVSEFFGATLTLDLSQDRGGTLVISEIGDTLQEAFDNARFKMHRELEERARKRALTARPAATALPAAAPRRLTFQSGK